jgi:hypothetical protein
MEYGWFVPGIFHNEPRKGSIIVENMHNHFITTL